MKMWKTGTVDWFDSLSGEGVIRDNTDGASYYVHYSTIELKSSRTQTTKKSEISERKNLSAGASVKFQVHETIYSKQISKVQPS